MLSLNNTNRQRNTHKSHFSKVVVARRRAFLPFTLLSFKKKKKINLRWIWASLVAQLVKNPPAMWETWVRSLGWADPLEKGKATHSSILA